MSNLTDEQIIKLQAQQLFAARAELAEAKRRADLVELAMNAEEELRITAQQERDQLAAKLKLAQETEWAACEHAARWEERVEQLTARVKTLEDALSGSGKDSERLNAYEEMHHNGIRPGFNYALKVWEFGNDDLSGGVGRYKTLREVIDIAMQALATKKPPAEPMPDTCIHGLPMAISCVRCMDAKEPK